MRTAISLSILLVMIVPGLVLNASDFSVYGIVRTTGSLLAIFLIDLAVALERSRKIL